MQHPTCTNIRIRSVDDAHKIFYAVQQGLLQMVTRRLDADERMQLRAGCVYAWEERGPHTEFSGLGIERFTEGRRWSPSRVRDEFLFYYEKYSPSPDCANPHPPRDWDPLVKQTYSVWVETDRGRRKWHLTAYFTQATVDQLGSIDDMRVVRDLAVPENMFKSTRVAKSRGKNDETRTGESFKSPAASITSRYAPFPMPTLSNQPESPGQILMFQPYNNHDASASQVQDDTEVAAQQFPFVCSSNPSPTNAVGFQDLNQHHTQAYRPLLPSIHSRNPADNLHRDLRKYNYPSQQVPVGLNNDATTPSASLPQARSDKEGISLGAPHSIHPPAISLPANPSPSAASYCNVDGIQPYVPHNQIFPSSTPGWGHVDSGSGALSSQNTSVHCRDGVVGLAASATSIGSSYPPSHNEINTANEPESYQTMAPYLNPVHENLAGGNSVPRESLPPLSILHQTYSFSYDLSVSMVAPTTVTPPSESLNDVFSHKPSTSAAEPSRKSKVRLETSRSGGLSRDLDLAPLNALSRRQPYRREPVDDEALRLLWPRSP